jgi:hypothetical protein
LTRQLIVNISFVVEDCVRLYNFHDRSCVGVAARAELACQRLVTFRGHDLRRQLASPCRGGPAARAIFHRSSDVTSVPLHQPCSLPHDNSVSAVSYTCPYSVLWPEANSIARADDPVCQILSLSCYTPFQKQQRASENIRSFKTRIQIL